MSATASASPLPAATDDITPVALALYCHADPDSFVALRCFPQHDKGKPAEWLVDVRAGDLPALVAAIGRGIHRAAFATDPEVFSPVTGATFTTPGTAKTKDIKNGLAVAVELDSGDTAAALARLEALIGPATLVVLSGGIWVDPSTGEIHPKLHAYWRLSEPTTDEADHALLHAARRDAAILAGGDMSGTPVAHCFRFPGSLNRKDPDRPARCTVERLNGDAEVHLAEAAEALAEAVEGAGLNGAGRHKGNGSAYRGQRELQAEPALVAAAMAFIPNEADPDPIREKAREKEYVRWVHWAYAIAGATGGEGYDIFSAWSAKFTAKHNDAETKALWDRVLAAKPTGIGAGSIFHEAKLHGWVDPRGRQVPRAVGAEKKDAANGPTAGQGTSQTPQPTEGGTDDGGADGGGRVPPPGGPDDGDDDSGEPEGEDEQPNPDWDQDTGPDGEVPPPGEDAGDGPGEADIATEIEIIPPDDVLNAIAELGPNITRKMIVDLFNKRYVMAVDGNKPLVMWTAFDPLLKRDRIERASFEDFKKFFSNRKLTIPSKPRPVTKNFGEWWLEDPNRRQFLGGVVFSPGGVTPPHMLNLWRDWAVKPAPGDWSLMHAHIHHVICGGRKHITRYVIRWLAHMIQRPYLPGEVAIVMRGLKGVGKGVFGKWLLRLCGQHGLHVINATHLTGRFMGHLRDVLFVFADEALFAGDKQHEGILKGLITEHTLLIEPKHLTPVMAANLLHILMSSNNDWVVPATHDERRYLMLDVLATHIGDFGYFGALNEQMESGGLAAMLHDLMHMDLGDFHPRRVPDTEELGEQKMHSLDSARRWWMAVLSRGFVWKSRYGHREFLQWDEFVTTELLNRSYSQWCAENRINYPASRVAVGKMMTAIYPYSRPHKSHPVYEADSVEHDAPQPVVKLPNQMGYRVGTIDNARALFRDAIKLAPGAAEWDRPVSDC